MIISLIVFVFILVPIPILAYVARKRDEPGSDLGGKDFGALAVGISAAATGNSGFIMTGAVGLGYAYGLQWVLLPLAWLLGDVIFWSLGPHNINRYANEHNSSTITDLIKGGGTGAVPTSIVLLGSAIATVLLGAYVSSQWVAGALIISPLVDLEQPYLIIAIGVFVISYSAIGKFRGSIYTDLYQATIMIIICVSSLVAVYREPTVSVDLAGGFYSLSGNMGMSILIAFVIGYAFASIGFGFGQPQVLTRYMAGKNPEEVRSAKWIYISFLQFTWIGMTVFGVMLRGTGMLAEDPEAALVNYFEQEGRFVLLGVAAAGVFAAVASTVDSIILAIGDIISRAIGEMVKGRSINSIWILIVFGSATVGAALMSESTVFDIALFAVSMTGGIFAGPVIVRVFGFRHTDTSVLSALIAGLVASSSWRLLGYESVLNEALVGIVAALSVNYLVNTIVNR